MKRKVDDLISSFILHKENCLKAGYIVRDKHFHELFAGMLKDFLKSTIELKEIMIKEKDEESANLLLAVECFCEALRSEMLMWLSLKKEDPNTAWDHLIDSQGWIKSSARATYNELLGQQEYAEKLDVIERVVFPPQMFNSPGMVISGIECSICKTDYGKCDHIAGKAYMGRFCVEVVKKIESFTHLAIVTDPYNKKARITGSSQPNGKWQDYMTWKETRDKTRTMKGPKRLE